MIFREPDIFREDRVVGEIAEIYQDAFGEAPWNEGFQCPVCKDIFPRTAMGLTCPTCLEKRQHKIPLVRFWTLARVLQDFYAEMRRPGARCFIAEEVQGDFADTRGFAWGYAMTEEQFRSEHKIPKACQLPDRFFYLDEIAVDPNHQGRGIGKLLAEKIFGEQPENQIVLRTHQDSIMHHLIVGMGGKTIHKLPRSRIIMLLAAP